MAGLSSIFKSLIALCSAQSTGGSCEFRRKSSNRVYTRSHSGCYTHNWGVESVKACIIWPCSDPEYQR
nr:MAG TPA_asm: hypothetical protein [Caudoviricetes sp.]